MCSVPGLHVKLFSALQGEPCSESRSPQHRAQDRWAEHEGNPVQTSLALRPRSCQMVMLARGTRCAHHTLWRHFQQKAIPALRVLSAAPWGPGTNRGEEGQRGLVVGAQEREPAFQHLLCGLGHLTSPRWV